MMNVLAIIPARGGSKGIPNKNIKELSGKPLLQYTSEVALASKKISKVILSSDADQIIKVGKELGLEVPFKRPSELAQDNTPTLPVIQHAISYFQKKGEFFDAVCILQTTTPFRTVEFIDNAIDVFERNNADSLISVLEIPHEFNPHWAFIEHKEGQLSIATGDQEIIPRRQDLPKAYHRDGSIYITKTKVVMNNHSLFGKSISFVKSSPATYVNIDTSEDWLKAENLVKEIQ